MNLNDTPSAGFLPESDFPAWPPRRMAAGCDQQGRYETRQPMAAEACTELDSEVDPQASAIFWTAYLALVLVVVVATLAAYWPG